MEALRSYSRTISPFALTVLRVVAGIIMTVHGWMKLADYSGWIESVGGMGIPAPEIFGALAMAAELAGGIGLVLGLLTPIAAFGVLCNMLVAIFVVHLENGLLARDGGFEFPLILGATALFFMVRGAGPISLDRALFGRHRHVEPHERGRTSSPFGREAHV